MTRCPRYCPSVIVAHNIMRYAIKFKFNNFCLIFKIFKRLPLVIDINIQNHCVVSIYKSCMKLSHCGCRNLLALVQLIPLREPHGDDRVGDAQLCDGVVDLLQARIVGLENIFRLGSSGVPELKNSKMLSVQRARRCHRLSAVTVWGSTEITSRSTAATEATLSHRHDLPGLGAGLRVCSR